MEYLIYRTSIPSQYIDIELALAAAAGQTIELQLPAWRPGRYELANYAQKIRSLRVKGTSGENVPLNRLSKDRWSFTAQEEGQYRIQYQYHASQMDAGGSWSDDEQLYINFINLAFQIIGREQEEIAVCLELPEDYKIATALPFSSHCVLKADGFQHLVDSPLIASPNLEHHSYQVNNHRFHLWFQGQVHFDMDVLIQHFTNFSRAQINAFGNFPTDDYHFLFQLLPYSHYHGVEHQFSTVITLGPAKDLGSKALMDRLLGVSSHELYHFWNVCRIRPKELLPYDFSKEAYIDTGIVAEGVTTYMGDLFLWQSGYYADRDYLGILEKLINREFEQFGWKNHSVVESSWDLWLDGYKPGAPDRKVSIYNRGALLSLCLDLMLIRSESSLSQVMRMMWDNFGQRGLGYGLKDFQAIIAEEAKDTDVAEAFFAQFVYGTEHLLPTLRDCLASAGISLGEEKRNDFASGYGLILDEGTKVKSVHPHSPAYDKIMVGDMIQSQELQQSPAGNLLNLSIQRYGRDLEITLSKTADTYYNQYRLYIHSPKELSYWKNS